MESCHSFFHLGVYKRPNGLAHLPPIIARQLALTTTISGKWPPRTSAEGGQVEPVLGTPGLPGRLKSILAWQ